MDAKSSKACFGTWALAVVAACCTITVSRAAGDALAPAVHITIGIPSPHSRIGDGTNSADGGEPIRQSLAKSLGISLLPVVALQSKVTDQIVSEETALHCDYSR